MPNTLNIDLNDKYVIISAKSLHGSRYNNPVHRVFLVSGGFGAIAKTPNMMSTALFGTFISSLREARQEGYQVERLAEEDEFEEANKLGKIITMEDRIIRYTKFLENFVDMENEIGTLEKYVAHEDITHYNKLKYCTMKKDVHPQFPHIELNPDGKPIRSVCVGCGGVITYFNLDITSMIDSMTLDEWQEAFESEWGLN